MKLENNTEATAQNPTQEGGGSNSSDLLAGDKTRKPLKAGNIYQYFGCTAKLIIKYVAFRGHEEDDGGLEGVSVDWIRGRKKERGMFYPCKNDEQFFAMDIFSNAFDPAS